VGTSIFLVDENSNDLRFKATTIKATQLVSDVLVPLHESIAGEILLSQKPLIVYDVQSDKRFFDKIDKILGFESKTLIGVPLIINERCIGVLEAVNKGGEGIFSEDDVDTLTALAAHASIAIENARLYESVLGTANVLEQRVQERTAELKLRNEELSAYHHTVAHDLKNLLSIIISYSKILEDDYPIVSEKELGESLRSTTDYAFKMSSVIDELLYLAEVRDTEVETQLLDMTTIVEEAKKRVTFMLKEFDAELTLLDTWPDAVGYGPWVEEVWVNYISNAIKYGGKPPIIQLGATEQPGGKVRFWIKDNGSGITPKDQSGLFTRFTPFDQYRKKGHGLGLSIVQRIIEKLGGQVGVESTLGQGSTFNFTLSAHKKTISA
jgi:signal transduction histidine kinase